MEYFSKKRLFKGGGEGVTEIDIVFFRQIMQVNCADMHFTQKFQQNNHPFHFMGHFIPDFQPIILYYWKNRLTSDKATVT